MRVLVFGASITQGFWDTEGGWVARLRKHYDKLQIDKPETDQPVIFNMGISADTVGDVLNRFVPETEARKRHGDVAFIFSVGTNNAAVGAYRTQDFKSNPAQYKNEMTQLILSAKKYSNRILLVGLPSCDEAKTTPVSWADVFYTNERIKIIENLMKEVAIEQSLTFIPIYDEFKNLQDKGEDNLYDGLHPNNVGHEIICNLVKPELEKLLERAD